MSKVIVFEGLDYAGKTTQLFLSEKYLKDQNIPYFKTKAPGGTPIGDEIRSILLRNDGLKMNPISQFLLFSASINEVIRGHINPSLEKNFHVLLDRFFFSTLAYQRKEIIGIDPRPVIDAIVPRDLLQKTHVLFFQIDYDTYKKRSENEGIRNDMDIVSEQEFLARRKEYNLSLHNGDGHVVHYIDGNHDVDAVWNTVKNILIKIVS